MNIDLARRFLLDMLPTEAQIPVNEVFNAMKDHPRTLLHNGIIWNNLHYFKSENKALSVAASNGFISGFALCYCLKFPEIEKQVQSYVETAARSRGENVINFLAMKKEN